VLAVEAVHITQTLPPVLAALSRATAAATAAMEYITERHLAVPVLAAIQEMAAAVPQAPVLGTLVLAVGEEAAVAAATQTLTKVAVAVAASVFWAKVPTVLLGAMRTMLA